MDALDYRAIFDALPGLNIVLRPEDPKYIILAVNKAYATATGINAVDILNRDFFEVFREKPADLRNSFRQVVATKSSHTLNGLQRIENLPLLGQGGEVSFIIHRIPPTFPEIEEKLPSREARFTLAFAMAPIGMVLLTPDGQILEVNQAYLDTLGCSREELMSRDSSSFTHPEDIQRTKDFFKALQHNPQNSGSIEKRYLRKNGEVLWSCASATLRRDSHGKPEEVIAIVEDITERKRAEARFSFLAESIPQMVWTAKPDGMLDYLNHQGAAYFGLSRELLLKDGWLQMVHPEEQQNTISRWKHSLETGQPYETEFRLRRGSDHSWRWHLARALPLAGDSGNVVQWFGTCTDIEDQKQAAANFRQQWQTFDTALSNTPDFIYTFDLEGRFTYVNRSLLALWGKSLADVIGKNFFELDYPPELAEKLQRQIQQTIHSRQPLRDQTFYTGISGNAGYYDYIFVPVLNQNGQVWEVAGSTRDITESNNAAKQIEEDRRRWRELLLHTPAAIVVLRGPHHVIEWVNHDYEKLAGRPAEFLVGKPAPEAVPEVGGQAYFDLLNGVYNTGTPFVGHEAHVRLSSGAESLRDVYVNFVLLPTRSADGDIDGIFAHITDVTDAVVSRSLIEESEKQFRTLAETIPHLAWKADESGNFFWFNRRWYDYTGTTFEEIKGSAWQQLVDPSALPDVITEWQRSISGGDPFELVFPLRRADGAFRTFLTRLEPVKDGAGRVVRWFGTNTDITEQRRTEQELRRMNRELEEFAYVASHDLQEPLRMVNIYTELILRNKDGDKEKLGQYSEFVQQGVSRMEALIHDLLTFSRSVHTEEVRVGQADLSTALKDALSVLRTRIEDTGAVITASSLPQVRGDTAQLSHVFQNILSNALKYRRSNAPAEVHIASQHVHNEWIISVRDNGIGFDPQYAERIFGLFKRLHKDEYPGTGLGLAICKRIIERYGGRIWAKAEVGEGATFYFALPHVEDEQH